MNRHTSLYVLLIFTLIPSGAETFAQGGSRLQEDPPPSRVDSMRLTAEEIQAGWRFFQFDELGISFRYMADSDSPDLSSALFPYTRDQQKWKSFTSERLGIQFQYPPEFEVYVGRRYFTHEEDCDSSLMISLGAPEFGEDDKPTGTFCTMMTIYFSTARFDEIAADNLFEHAEVYDTGDTLQEHPRIDSAQWDILGRQGMRYSATSFAGKNCRGLRGYNFRGLYQRGKGYWGLGDFVAALLVFERTGACSTVFTFGTASPEYIDDHVNVELAEVTFYRIIATAETTR